MKWSEMLPYVLPSVHGCPDGLAIRHLTDAARVFCGRTLAWNYSCRAIPSAADIADYTLQIGPDEEVVRVLLCTVDDREYGIPTGVLGRQSSRLNNALGGTEQCVLLGTQDFRLTPAPTLDDQHIVLDVAVKPRLGCDGWIADMDEHTSDIVHGALATLCSIPKVTWRDSEEAEKQRAQFNSRIAVVAAKVQAGFGRSRRSGCMTFF